MTTLVTGGTGFVGSNIVKVLAQRGHKVVSVDIAPPDDMVLRYNNDVADRITWVPGDILDGQTLADAVEGRSIDRVVHAAVYTGTRARHPDRVSGTERGAAGHSARTPRRH